MKRVCFVICLLLCACTSNDSKLIKNISTFENYKEFEAYSIWREEGFSVKRQLAIFGSSFPDNRPFFVFERLLHNANEYLCVKEFYQKSRNIDVIRELEVTFLDKSSILARMTEKEKKELGAEYKNYAIFYLRPEYIDNIDDVTDIKIRGSRAFARILQNDLQDFIANFKKFALDKS